MTIEEYQEICDYLHDVIEGTPWEGHVYTVGGCCRDAIMGREIHDVDLAVTVPDGGVLFAVWLQQEGLTEGPPTLFRRFSTSKLRLKAFPQHEIEVVQTRREQYTDANSRNPEVCFGSIMDDCERRDLTINSLYKDVTTGEVLDLTGRGIPDIHAHRIDTPMDPDETYSDDPIRILRTLRFASRYGWEIPDTVMEAMKRNAGRLRIVRRPRIATEFEKIMQSEDPVGILKTMKDIGAVFRVLPELAHLYRIKDHSKEWKREEAEEGREPGQRKVKGPSQQEKLPTLWDVTMEHLAEAGPTLEERFAALFTEFYRVKVPYSDIKPDRDEKGGRRNRRGRGRSAVVSTALKRLLYPSDFIRKVKDLLPPVPDGWRPETDTKDQTPVRRRRKRSKERNSANTADNAEGSRRKKRRRRRKSRSKTLPTA